MRYDVLVIFSPKISGIQSHNRDQIRIKADANYLPRTGEFISFTGVDAIELRVEKVIHDLTGIPLVEVTDDDWFMDEREAKNRVDFYKCQK